MRRATLHDLGHERCVFRADVLIVEGTSWSKSQNLLIKAHPLVHLSFFDVADDMVDGARWVGLAHGGP